MKNVLFFTLGSVNLQVWCVIWSIFYAEHSNNEVWPLNDFSWQTVLIISDAGLKLLLKLSQSWYHITLFQLRIVVKWWGCITFMGKRNFFLIPFYDTNWNLASKVNFKWLTSLKHIKCILHFTNFFYIFKIRCCHLELQPSLRQFMQNLERVFFYLFN